MPPSDFLIPFGLVWGWMLLVVLASVVYRRRTGKPIWAADAPGALFVEKRASGASRRTWWTGLAGAQNVLYVAVTPSRIVVRPHFPLNLMFLPEIYGLEQSVPITALRDVEQVRRLGGDVTRLTFDNTAGQPESFDLLLRNRRGFLDALVQAGRSVEGAAAPQPMSASTR